MNKGFKDYFSNQSDIYARSRPTYPVELFEYLVSLVPSKNLAWDCATGNGQATISLARYFKHIIATDASPQKISNAFKHPKINYYVAPAESSEIDNGTVDLITIASGLHWFDTDNFYREANRVLKENGIIAAWCYTGSKINPEIDKILDHFLFGTLSEYWPEENRLVWNKYRDLKFPFHEIEYPDFSFKSTISCSQLLDSLNSISATQRYKEANGKDPVLMITSDLKAAWGDLAKDKIVTRDFCMRLGRKNLKLQK